MNDVHVGLGRNILVAHALKSTYPAPLHIGHARFDIIGRICILMSCFFVMSCAGPGYYMQAASGHLKLMRDRQDVEELLANSETHPEIVSNLEAANGILEFAETNLGLPAGESYQSYVETGRDAVVWNVVASPEFSLEAKTWCFPVAGCVPYRGYFNEEKAQKLATKLKDKGLDVSISPATAYSTLGWFDDPLLDTMLNGSETQLAGTIFHELAHARLYIKGDTAFNESYATFVEKVGVRTWLTSNGNEEKLQEWVAVRQAVQQFNDLLSTTRDRLGELYRSAVPEAEMRDKKAAIFADLKNQWVALKGQHWQGRDYFSRWFSADLGNAQFALHQSYEGGVCAFNRLFEETDKDIIDFHRRADSLAERDSDQRRAWLNESCQPIASGHDL